MKVIQTLNDVESLKAQSITPKELIQVIEQDFLTLYEAGGSEDDRLSFRLPYQESIILIEKGDNLLELVDNPIELEYVEKHKQGQVEFYRLAKRFEHEFQLVYTLLNIHDDETEQFLRDHSEWNEGLGDFRV
ncbi:hypothetical protein [Lysinibacillus antri]|uniref:Uncharacterized protein n=1 Tax=Lysinibacillus antri TaxID=2498145 RepID=A0A432LDA1_9BACI|nr:hypothetical protein [Lysinibacillus antri]RUL54153.1 hypothetical protein EK386_06485 [Lysinibacillus antri]